MSVTRAWLLTAAVLLSGAMAASAQTAAPATGAAPAARPPDTAPAESEITARSWPEKTALWVGDRVLFTIEIECAPTVDILSADLASEKLGLTGLEVVDASSERVMSESGRLTYRFLYRLTTYETGETPLKINPLTVRYGRRRAGQRLEEAAPAGEIKIAGADLALRSTIPDEIASVDPRDRRPLQNIPRILSLARPIGIGLMLVSAAPLLVWAGTLVTRRRPKVKRRDTRAARNQARAALEEVQAADASTEAARREAFTRLDAVVRDHLGNVTGLPAQALTPTELGERLATTKTTVPADAVTEVLTDCEKARYGPPALLPSADRFRDSASAAERILAAR
jgi:hypothetical protein